MATTNSERVGQALELLQQGLAPFVEREFTSTSPKGMALERARAFFRDPKPPSTDGEFSEWDVAALLNVINWAWADVFRQTLGQHDRTLANDLLHWRNEWAHQRKIPSENVDRALDSAARLLTSVSAPQAEEVAEMRLALRRLVFTEQTRRRSEAKSATLIDAEAVTNLKPWREVVTPHPDVASGNYQQAEFAADLWQVYQGNANDEYGDPAEFFRRTFLTESLKQLLVQGVQRLGGQGGDPVVQLQTNFGGGKTHSMLALYHLSSGAEAKDLPGIEDVLSQAGVEALPKDVKRAVLVGTKLSPGRPEEHDGVEVRTLWGELAWQLGGREAYDRIRENDESGTSPGDALRQLFDDYGPCLILIDEWVAYARQLHDASDLPGGSFETQFTFAQTLTEAAKASKHCLLLISLPASDTNGASTDLEDAEVGGVRGREALQRLRNVVARVESSWRPATAEEGFEIVRRRLFEDLPDDEAYRQRDLTARAFAEHYQKNRDHFPPECAEKKYEERIQAAYPIHPEIFDRLYDDWSALVTFQRTRGVLRLMASVIHTLWEQGDRNPLILPAMIPIDSQRVESELLRYLSDNWRPIIGQDVDGTSSNPVKIDNEVSNLGKLQATRRVARTIYLGSAPGKFETNRGIQERRVKLGCIMPGERPQLFEDAMGYLARRARYLYEDDKRYWYATQPNVTSLAEDRALTRSEEDIHKELRRRLEIATRSPDARGDFAAVHLLPSDSGEVPEERETRLVILDVDHAHRSGEDSPAEARAESILLTRGSQPRTYRNTLLFLAAEERRWPDLEDAIRAYLSWQSITSEVKELNLDPHQETQAQNQLKSADDSVNSRLPETYCIALAPSQAKEAQSPITWQSTRLRLQGGDPLAKRISARMSRDEALVTKLGATIIRRHLDEVPLWPRTDGELVSHIEIRALVEHFAKLLYLPRLAGPSVLTNALREGVTLMVTDDTFAYAESYDEARERYAGLKNIGLPDIPEHDPGLIVRADVAAAQLKAEDPGGDSEKNAPDSPELSPPLPDPEPARPRRYHGTVVLDAERVGRSAAEIADEVITHLVNLDGSDVKVKIEIEARLPDGAPEQVVRTVTENGRELRFESGSGFEQE